MPYCARYEPEFPEGRSPLTLTEAIPASSFQFCEGESPTAGLDRHFSLSGPNKCGAPVRGSSAGLQCPS